MKATHLTIRILIALFLVICILVHVVGLVRPFSEETVLSHILHIISYGMCLAAFWLYFPFRIPVYLIGAVYPLYIHGDCLAHYLSAEHRVNIICLLVVVVLPLAAIWMFYEHRKTA